jgi:NADH-quinone oxidoreductase subunit M
MLSWLLFAPILGAGLILCIPKGAIKLIRTVALATTVVTGVISLRIADVFDLTVGHMQLEQMIPWIPSIQVSYHLGIDGISLPLILLTTLISLIACLASCGIADRVKEYFVFLLLLVTGMLGTFLALDLFLFYVFWEIVLVPMYFLIGMWGGGRREYSAMKFFLYTLAGSLAMLVGILSIYVMTGTMDMIALRDQAGTMFSVQAQHWLFLAFFFAFAIKVPIVPFHTWLPDAHVDAPTPVSVILAGVLLKMGGYGFFRISYPLFPAGAEWFAPVMMTLGVINIVYGAMVAMAQTDFKRLVAYSSVSHMGFVLVGLASLNHTGLQGGLLQMISHGLISGGMFLLVGVIYDRAHTRDLHAFGGLGVQLPVYAGFLMFFSMASLGLPGLSGFAAEFLSLLGALLAHPLLTIVAMLGLVMGAAYTLLAIQKLLLGTPNPQWKALPDMRPRELATLIPLLVLITLVGVYPWCVLQLQDASVARLLTAFGIPSL